MNIIKLNNSEFEVENYYRSTSFTDNVIQSSGNCVLNTSDTSALYEIAESPITLIQITKDDEIIYNLDNITAHIENIIESFSADRFYINVNFIFE